MHLFPETHALPHVVHIPAGEVFYTVGILVGLILWGFAIVWFIVAIMMIATSGGFPFNMGWWGFIFPVGECFLLPSPGSNLHAMLILLVPCRCFHASHNDTRDGTGI